MKICLMTHKTIKCSRILIGILLFIAISAFEAQSTRKVLFLGNSYTAFNNLPQMIRDVALSAGDTLIFDVNAPGGYKLTDHTLDLTTQNKIKAGGWDYVVIQGQSQEPVILANQFFSGGQALYNLIRQHNPCAVVVPYMTWGRKNGDAANCPAFPLMCNYQLMDSTIRVRYLNLAASLNGEVSPVSVVWNHLRQNYPNIDLYQSDESHPSVAGSYAAACCFYAALFKKDPALISFNAALSSTVASVIRSAAKAKVFDSLLVWDFKKPPVSAFGFQIGAGTNQVIFSPLNQGVRQTYFWNFGDGNTSSASHPTHSYVNNGTYTITLTTTNCNLQGWHTSISDTVIQFCAHTPTIYTGNPWLCRYDTLWTQTADSYQWYCNNVPLPETNQFLANYSQYNISGFSVLSALNGCGELSQVFAQTPQWSGYYFDGVGDPCQGDTVAFAVLHTNGSLPGTGKILWFKNNVLLPALVNEDTLLITSSGKYECKVVDPGSNCPFDTTSAVLEYDCGGVGVGLEESGVRPAWNIFPNPATDVINLKYFGNTIKANAWIYDVMGIVVKEIQISGSAAIRIADLHDGIYFIHVKGSESPPLKLIKH